MSKILMSHINPKENQLHVKKPLHGIFIKQRRVGEYNCSTGRLHIAIGQV